jgi:hypothetical protein
MNGKVVLSLGRSRTAVTAHIGVLCGCVLLATCGPSTPSPDGLVALVEVRVVDAASQGVASAKIEAKNPCCQGESALTGSDGAVTLELLHQMDVDITLTPPDGFSVATNQANPIQVLPVNSKTTRVTFRVQRSTPVP